MSKKSDQTQSINVKGKSIELKVVLPWFIVAVMLSSVSGLVGGWFIHSNAMADAASQTAQQAQSIVKSLK